MIAVDLPHALLDLHVLRATLPVAMGAMQPSLQVTQLLSVKAETPLHSDEAVKKAVRDLLRQGGFKPTGRSKPASEFLEQSALAGQMPQINAVIDACNAVSLHSGLPISAVDADKLTGSLQIRLGQPGEKYVFNAAGHEIDVEGLLCLCDADGPCANAVKDAQRTKTTSETLRLLIVVWGTRTLPDRASQTAAWLGQQLTGLGARIEVDA